MKRTSSAQKNPWRGEATDPTTESAQDESEDSVLETSSCVRLTRMALATTNNG